MTLDTPSVLGKKLKRIQELKSRYYIGASGEVMLFWAGGWKPYDYVAARETKYEV